MPEPLKPNAPSASADEQDTYARRVGATVKGKWHIDALLGVGGMAAVYAATHRNGQKVALKILHIDFARDKVVCERFLREAYVSNKIGHPACVRVLDDDVTEEEEPYLVMELLDGETLRELWMHTGRRMPVVRVLEIADPILDCLAACHAIGVIHRDLKPANIFVCKDGAVKVLDFGVAQFRSATAERTATGTALGTPAYMSPEQAMGLVDQLDGRTDLFSVGAMVHALVSGHRINKGRTENEALVMAATTPVPSIARIAPDLPVEVVAIIDKALAWDRRNRFKDAKEMQSAVRAALRKLDPSHAADVPRAASIAPPAAPSAPPPAPAAPGPQPRADAEPALPPDAPDIVALRDIWKRIDRALPNVRQFGWEHPATERALRTAFEGIAEALRANPRAMEMTLRPYSFVRATQTVWEPSAPFDSVPYHLFAAGVRALRVKPGVTLDELRELLAVILMEPARDLPPEDDLVTALWEKALPHVEYDVVDAFAEGDAAAREAFFAESDEVEQRAGEAARARANRLEAKAMAVATDKSALERSKASPMSLDEVVLRVYASQLELPRDRWSERYVDVVVEGLIDAAKNKDAQLVLASLRRSAADLVVAGRVDVITGLHEAMKERIEARLPAAPAQQLAAALTNALFGAETLELMLKRLHEEPARAAAFEPVLATLSDKELPTVLGAMKGGAPEPMQKALLRYVERVLPGHEIEIATAAAQSEPAVARALIARLAASTSPAARQALLGLTQAESPDVRIEAKMQMAASNPEAMGAELAAMCEDASPLVRLAALRAVARFVVRGAWPTIARRAKAPNVHEVGTDERAELFGALVSVSPDRGEPILIEIAKKAGVFVSEEREAVRVSAIEALGACSRSALALSAMRDVAGARWGTSEDTRAAAAAAAEQIAARVAQHGSTAAMRAVANPELPS